MKSAEIREWNKEHAHKAKISRFWMGELLEKNLGLIERQAYFIGFKPWKEDLVQEGLIGLMQAARLYDPNKGAFSTYALRSVRRNMWEFVNRKTKVVKPPRVATSEDYVRCDAVDISPLEITDDREYFLHSDAKDVAALIRKAVGRRRYKALLGSYGIGKAMRITGKEMGVSAARVKQLCDEALVKIEGCFCEAITNE